MRLLNTKEGILKFVEGLSPDEANQVLKQIAVNNAIGGFVVDRDENGELVVDLMPKSDRKM